MSRLTSWWRQPDQFDWITTFLRQRSLIRSAQVSLAIVSASAAGDRLLQIVAELLRERTQSDAIICRAGGEEFLIAVTCSPDKVAALAGPLCSAIAGHPSGITVSIGTASAELHVLRTSAGGTSLDELVCAADRAMYAAKRLGGNQARRFG